MAPLPGATPGRRSLTGKISTERLSPEKKPGPQYRPIHWALNNLGPKACLATRVVGGLHPLAARGDSRDILADEATSPALRLASPSTREMRRSTSLPDESADVRRPIT